jgi:hypothetical protein
MPLAEVNLVNTQTLFTLNVVFIVIAFTRRTLNCLSAKRRENHAPSPSVSWPPQQKIQSWSLFLNHKKVFGHDSFKSSVIENPYSFNTHMLLSMHVHFLIITYIHISCIFSELVSQHTSVRTTQFLYIYTYIQYSCESLTVTVLDLNHYCLICYYLRPEPLLFDLLLS